MIADMITNSAIEGKIFFDGAAEVFSFLYDGIELGTNVVLLPSI